MNPSIKLTQTLRSLLPAVMLLGASAAGCAANVDGVDDSTSDELTGDFKDLHLQGKSGRCSVDVDYAIIRGAGSAATSTMFKSLALSLSSVCAEAKAVGYDAQSLAVGDLDIEGSVGESFFDRTGTGGFASITYEHRLMLQWRQYDAKEDREVLTEWGTEHQTGFTFDLATGKRLRLDDVFTAAGIDEIVDHCVKSSGFVGGQVRKLCEDAVARASFIIDDRGVELRPVFEPYGFFSWGKAHQYLKTTGPITDYVKRIHPIWF